MPATEIFRTLGKKVFKGFVALCVVGVFSSVSFADQGTTSKAAAENSTARTRYSSAEGKIERAGQATGRGIERAGEATRVEGSNVRPKPLNGEARPKPLNGE